MRADGPKNPPEWTVNRDFRAVDGGTLNENVRMSHFLSNLYTEGSLHKAPYQFGATVRWAPKAQELIRGKDAAAVVPAGGARASVERAGKLHRVFFPATYPDTDERLSIRPDGGIEHDIILQHAPAMPDDSYALAYTGALQLSAGLSVWCDGKQVTGPYTTKNGLHIKNSFGNTVFFLRPPYAFDATVTRADGSLDTEKHAQEEYSGCETACEYRVDFNESGVKLAVVTPGEWLADPVRAYPVVIDPNMGPYGLADGSPPIYTGTAGADTIIPANAGGQLVAMTNVCATKADNAAGQIPMPFSFEYYGVVHPTGAPLYVHLDGFASWQNPQPCADTDNQPIPTPAYPNDAFFAYWDDLKLTNQDGSGVYWFVDGSAPSRRLVIEWYKMGFASGSSTDIISFNLVLFECDNKIEFIIGQANEKDRGFCSVGIEDPGGMIGIQYDFNSALNGAVSQGNPQVNPFFNNNVDPNNPFGGGGGVFGGAGGVGGGTVVNTGPGNTPQAQPISPGTAVTFQRAAAGFVTVKFTPLTGCIPHTVCFQAQVTTPVSVCATGGQTIPRSFGFHWRFQDGAEGFTQNVCHTYVRPGIFQVALAITDELGTSTTLNFTVKVCDVPQVVIVADPQGGMVPLTVNLQAYANSPNVTLNKPVAWVLDRLGAENEPGQFVPIYATTGSPLTLILDSPGMYRLTATFDGTDTATGMPTTGAGTVFIFVASPIDVIEDSLLITDSQFTIDWVGKQPAANQAGLPSNSGSVLPGLQLPANPENDRLSLRGYISLPGVSLSSLVNQRVRIILNGVDTVFDGVLDANGQAVLPTQGPSNPTANDTNLQTSRTGTFQINLPSGAFTCNITRSLYVDLGVSNATGWRLLPAFFRIEIGGIFPPAGSPGAMITYDYRSQAYNPGPPPSGAAKGIYHFGSFTRQGALGNKAPAGFNKPGGQTIMLSGAFMVLSAKLKLAGNTVFADLSGKLARYGGDDLRPRDNSDVVVSIGGFAEALNFTTTAGFKAKGKPPSQVFSFKRNKAFGQTGIAQLQWQNRAGNFRIKTYGMPNELVGLNPSTGVQLLTLGLQITPDGTQIYNGLSRFEVTKTSPTQFVRNSK
ncbi:MAG: PKD domain-containing protein [Planctomycetota bacterium]|nr:PKD domain-containing protein [Planctomycetota bacterium]